MNVMTDRNKNVFYKAFHPLDSNNQTSLTVTKQGSLSPYKLVVICFPGIYLITPLVNCSLLSCCKILSRYQFGLFRIYSPFLSSGCPPGYTRLSVSLQLEFYRDKSKASPWDASFHSLVKHYAQGREYSWWVGEKG